MKLSQRVAAALAGVGLAVGAAVVTVGSVQAAPPSVYLQARLTGATEVPGPGDADGRGTAVVRIRPGASLVCVNRLWYTKIDMPMMMHIHTGAAGVAGGVVVNLTPFLTDGTRCASVDQELAKAIARHPRQFYVNVHTAAFPGGAIRGQLRPVEA